MTGTITFKSLKHWKTTLTHVTYLGTIKKRWALHENSVLKKLRSVLETKSIERKGP